MSPRHSLELLYRMGPAWTLWRLGYALRKRTGWLKRGLPTTPLSAMELRDVLRAGLSDRREAVRSNQESSGERFFFPRGVPPTSDRLARIAGSDAVQRTIAAAEGVCQGRLAYYSRHEFDLGRPVVWLTNPFRGARHHVDSHWCDYPTFSRELGDVKDVWEPSRFSLAFCLGRAYAFSGDQRYPSAFWELFDSWCEQNPPNLGPNWKCGQEIAFRVMGLCFALHAFWNCPSTTDARIETFVKLMAVSGQRVARNIDYAYSQKNNHGISEALGLFTIGLLFPELRKAEQWREQGRAYLEDEIARQIYDDGSFVQHSMNYHRVMLHDCLWAVRLAELHGSPLSEGATKRIARAGEFLHEMLDEPSGGVPNYGNNDGALVLPLSGCDYADFRPTVQAARFQGTGRRVLDEGPWDEMLVWLYGDEALQAPRLTATPSSRRFDAGGYYTIRAADTWCMVRCHTYRDRPAHLDMLHVDLWHRGVNVLGDSGTYKYYAPDDPAAERYFKSIAAHNTIEIDGRDPLELVSRFLWLPWPAARCLEHTANRFVGEHFAYRRSPWRVTHRRTVEVAGNRWTIEDFLEGSGRHRVTLRWHLADGLFELDAGGRSLRVDMSCGPVTLHVDGPPGLTLAVRRGRADSERFCGWESRYYGERTARPVLEASGEFELSVRLHTTLDLPA